MRMKRRHADHRADTRGGALSCLPHVVADSPAYLSLKPFERALLLEILRRFNGYNNGEIALSYKVLGERLKGLNRSGPNNARIAEAVATLTEHGIIAEPELGSWFMRRARTYRLTFISCGKGPPYRPATNEYLQWTRLKEKNDGENPSPDKARRGDTQLPEPTAVRDHSSPENCENGSFPFLEVPSLGDAPSPLIEEPYPGAQTSAAIYPESGSRTHCKQCGEAFPPTHPKREFCAERCRKAAARQRRRDRRSRQEIHPERERRMK